MSRRRQKNPLVGRILLASVAAHVVVIPVLAYFGAFKKIEQSFHHQEVTIVPASPEKEKPVAPKEEPKKAAAPEKKASGQQESKAAKSDLNQPKVAASSAPAGVGDAGASVNPQGNGKAGEIPKTASPGPSAGTGGGGDAPKVAETKPVVKPVAEAPVKPKEEPKPEPKPVEKKAPVFVSAEPIDQPSPEIPDDLRDAAMDKSTAVMISVTEIGSAGAVSVASSSGVAELDSLAVRAAKKWRFKPATRDGEPVPGRVRLHVRFKVD
ncbi:MAG: TonB family protein [Armatimonadota bacterium]